MLLTLYKKVWITHLVAVLVPRMVRAIYRLQSSGGIAGDVWHGGSGRAAIAETVYILDNLRGSHMAANPTHGRLRLLRQGQKGLLVKGDDCRVLGQCSTS